MINLATSLRRYASTWLAHIKYGIVREMMFRGNFILWIVVETLWLSLHLTFIEVLYGHVDSVAGWGKYEMMMLVGTHYVIQQLFQAFLMSGLFGLSEHIRMGTLDFYLLKPINLQFLLSIHRFDMGGLLNTLIGIGVVCTAAHFLGIGITLANITIYLTLVFVGIFVHYGLLLIIVSLAFWTTQVQSAMMGYYTIIQIARLPKEAARGIIRVFFTYFLPALLIANVPVRSFQGLGTVEMWGKLLFFTTVFFAASVIIFNFGLKNYRSASS